MADSLGRAVMEFGGDDREFQRTADRVERKVKDTKTSFEGLVIQYSKLSLVNTAARSVSTAFQKMSEDLGSGEKSMAEFVREAAKGIPLVGGFIDLGFAFGEIASGAGVTTEALKKQSEEMEKHLDLVAKLTAAHGKLAQTQRDEAKKLAVGLAGKNLGAAVGAILGTEDDSKATADEVRQRVRASFKAQFDELDKLQREADLKLQKQSTDFSEGGEVFDAQKRRDAEKSVAILAKRAEQLRRDAAAAEEAALNKLGGATATEIGKRIAENIGGAFDVARTKLEGLILKFPELDKTAKKMVDENAASVQALAGNIEKFKTEMNALTTGRARGLISDDLFTKLADKSFFDQAARSVGSILDQFRPSAELILRLIDSNLGASGFAQRLGNALGSLVPGSIDFTPKRFQSSTVGLTDLANRIQEGAASETRKDPVQDGILKAVERTATAQEEARNILRNDLKKLGTVK